MKILLVGAHGTVGRAITTELGPRHSLISAGRRSGDVQLDLTDADGFARVLAHVAPLDAVVCAAGNVAFGPLEGLSPEQWELGLRDKLMGQVRLALAAIPHLVEGGSITLTAGILAEQPIRLGTSASLVNAGLEGFVRAAAIELPRGLRINAVSPSVLQESMAQFGPYFRGFEAVPAARVALAYSRSVEGGDTGKVYKVYG
jgi:NAD(P)-dependent dehydrogenase (short-subunit alcohol dehydrogenase family)